jgi:hypothetical protein
MRTRRSFLTWSLGVLTIAASVGASPALAADEKFRFALVVAKDSPVSDISSYDLKRLYKGDPINVAGKRLVPMNLPTSSPHRTHFDQAVLGMNPETVNRYWIDRKIRGQSGPPKAFDSVDLIQRVVARVDGGIGYVRVNEIRPDVKVVRVDGKLPKDPGYSLEY